MKFDVMKNLLDLGFFLALFFFFLGSFIAIYHGDRPPSRSAHVFFLSALLDGTFYG